MDGWRDTETGNRRERGVASDELRRHNLTAVLDRLHRLGPLSRSDLAQNTGLNRSTIAGLIGELARLGLVAERPGVASAGPGRPSPVVRVRSRGATVLALDVSVDSIAGATVGLGGHVFEQVRVSRPRGRYTPERTVEDLDRLCQPLLASLSGSHRLVGVGVAVAGVTRRSDGLVHLAPNLNWRNVPFGQLLAARLGVGDALWTANEADLGALAEYLRGAGAGAAHLVYLAGEAGLGAGIIQNGQPMLGTAGYAGEAGHMLLNPAGRECSCGGRGCWETEAGEAALAGRAGLSHLVGQALLEEVISRVEARDAQTVEALNTTGRWLGFGVGNLINVFNPDVVVVGGLYHELFPYLEDALAEAADSVSLAATGQGVRIVRGALGVDATLLGAAELALSKVISNPAAVRAIVPTEPPGMADGA